MSKIAKGIGKVFKKVGNAIKKVVKSPVFKWVAIAAAVVFTGGMATGAFAGAGALGKIASIPIIGDIASAGAAIGEGVASTVSGVLGIGDATVGMETGGAVASNAAPSLVEGGGFLDGAGGATQIANTGAAAAPGATTAASTPASLGVSIPQGTVAASAPAAGGDSLVRAAQVMTRGSMLASLGGAGVTAIGQASAERQRTAELAAQQDYDRRMHAGAPTLSDVQLQTLFGYKTPGIIAAAKNQKEA